jgi:hypothetical protein
VQSRGVVLRQEELEADNHKQTSRYGEGPAPSITFADSVRKCNQVMQSSPYLICNEGASQILEMQVLNVPRLEDVLKKVNDLSNMLLLSTEKINRLLVKLVSGMGN